MKLSKFTMMFALIGLILLLTSCSAPNSVSEQSIKNQTLNEISKLNTLNSKGQITLNDFKSIDILTLNDSYATDEIKEIKTLVKYKEYYHVFHGLSFLKDYIETGKLTICPGHSLSHYYVFMRHNETGFAEDNLNNAVGTFNRWTPLARAYNEKYSSVSDFNATVERIQKDIENIKNGNTTTTEQEIDWLANDASICVEDITSN